MALIFNCFREGTTRMPGFTNNMRTKELSGAK